MRGGVTEVSSAIPVGLKNSRPSTRLGLRLEGMASSFGCPISRVGTVFKVICARPAVAQIRATVMEKIVLDRMDIPAARRGERTILRISDANLGRALHGTGSVP